MNHPHEVWRNWHEQDSVVRLPDDDHQERLQLTSRSRNLAELIDFMLRGRFVPRVVQPKGVTDQQVMGLETVYLHDRMIPYPELAQGEGKQG